MLQNLNAAIDRRMPLWPASCCKAQHCCPGLAFQLVLPELQTEGKPGVVAAKLVSGSCW